MLYGTLGMYFMTATVSKNVDYILRLADEMWSILVMQVRNIFNNIALTS